MRLCSGKALESSSYTVLRVLSLDVQDTLMPATPGKTSDAEHLVFVVDDDAEVRASLQSLLRSVGLQVEIFGSASEFLASKIPNVPSCLVLDVRLPGISGLDFQAELTKAKIRSRSCSSPATATFRCRCGR